MTEIVSKRSKSDDYKDLTASANKGFTSANYQRNGETPNFAKVRSISRATRQVWIAEKQRTEAKIKEVSDTYVSAKAVPMISEIRSDYASRRADAVRKLKDGLNRVVRAKKMALGEYMMRPPETAVLNLLTAYNLRSGASVRELQALLARCGANYQSLQICRDICAKYDYTFAMPIDCDEYIADLDVIEETTGKLIEDFIDKPDGELTYNARMFFNYDDDCIFAVKNMGYSLADNDKTTENLTGVVPTAADSLKAVIELKKAEIKVAKENNDLQAAKDAGKDLNAAANFYEHNKDILMTEDERRKAAANEAAELLDGMID